MEGKDEDMVQAELGQKLNDEQLVEQVTEYLRGIEKKGTKVIALVGGPASGKGILSQQLADKLGNTAVLSTDNYLKGDRAWRRANVEDTGKDPLLKYDKDFLNEQVQRIIELEDGQELGIPIYDGASGVAIGKNPDDRPDNSTYPTKVNGNQDFVIVEGDFQFLDSEHLDKIIFLDVDEDVRLANKLLRDSVERREDSDTKANEEKITRYFKLRQETQFIPHTLPVKAKAELVIKAHAKPLEQPTSNSRFTYSYELERR